MAQRADEIPDWELEELIRIAIGRLRPDIANDFWNGSMRSSGPNIETGTRFGGLLFCPSPPHSHCA
jgi:hypothetical protein